MRTKGKVTANTVNGHRLLLSDKEILIADFNMEGAANEIYDLRFTESAFNAAAVLDEAGYDGENAIRELPEIISALLLCAESLNCLAASVGIPVEGESPKSDKSDDYGANVSLAVARAALDKIRGDK
jgi:hypothetical protein